jgi:hypothetical protein
LLRHCGLCWSYKVQEGTALDVAGNGRYAREVVVACKRERARRLHTVSPPDLAELAKSDPSALIVSADDMARALASALTAGDPEQLRHFGARENSA